MRQAIHFPKYTSRDVSILIGSMLPTAVLINFFLFEKSFLNSTATFLFSTAASFIYLSFCFFTYRLVAVQLRIRFPLDEQVGKRLTICVGIFLLMTALYISLLLLIYDSLHFLGYEYNENDFLQSFIAFILVNLFLTFLYEGTYRFEKFRSISTETALLKKEYMQGQLLGLKSHVNPHFLFNSLNTLSSLIHEDAGQAEDFLDHMSKVYRYLLRNNDEQLVTVETELNFIRSFGYLLKARYGTAIELSVEVDGDQKKMMMPPLTLQMIMENTLALNTLSKTAPLHVAVSSNHDWLEFANNVAPKLTSSEDGDLMLENISNKYRLLCQQDIIVRTTKTRRTIQLPLIPNPEKIAV